RYTEAMERLALHEGAAAAYDLIDATNLFIAETQPWSLAKHDADRDRLTEVLYDAAEALRVAAVLLLPVIPTSAAEILRRVGEARPASALRLDSDATWRNHGEKNILNAGALWPRLDSKGAPTVTDPTPTAPGAWNGPVASNAPAESNGPSGPAARDAASPANPPAAPGVSSAPAVAPEKIGIEEFSKVELRVAKVLEAERVPKSKKLMKLRIDVGSEQRTVVAGIADAYEPDALIGRSIVIVANLKPATLMGIESNGMVLAASPEGGGAILLNPESAVPGTRVR
ncbi:MAG: methionine--tRNA ligase subunit beta, partial [Acidobacteria bacterium]|nr:methionine--tRNA ligase subunit beta [Acidobacteriota bacterium]